VLGSSASTTTTQAEALRLALRPIGAVFDAAAGGDGCAAPGGCKLGGMGEQTVEMLVMMADLSKKLLIYGDVGTNSTSASTASTSTIANTSATHPSVTGASGAPDASSSAAPSVVQRNGQAYLEGWDSDAELEVSGLQVQSVYEVF
jgi:hypothetical protein